MLCVDLCNVTHAASQVADRNIVCEFVAEFVAFLAGLLALITCITCRTEVIPEIIAGA